MTEKSSTGWHRLNPGVISAWIGLATTVATLLATFAATTESVFGTSDTLFYALFHLVFTAYVICAVSLIVGGVVLGLATLVGVDEDSDGFFVILGGVAILVVVVLVPIMWDNLLSDLQDPDVSFLGGITGVRFTGLAILAGIGWLVYKYIIAPGQQAK